MSWDYITSFFKLMFCLVVFARENGDFNLYANIPKVILHFIDMVKNSLKEIKDEQLICNICKENMLNKLILLVSRCVCLCKCSNCVFREIFYFYNTAINLIRKFIHVHMYTFIQSLIIKSWT